MENKEYLMVVTVENRPAVLNRITSPFLKRHINLESLNIQETEVKGLSKIAMKVITSHYIVERVALQLDSMYDVSQVCIYEADGLLTKELALFKLPAAEVSELIEQYKDSFDLRIAMRAEEYTIVELSDSLEQVDRFVEILKSKNLLKEYSRSTNVSIPL